MKVGTIKYFANDRGFGFITPDDGSGDVFVHISAFQDSGITTPHEGVRLRFDTIAGGKGPRAIDVQLA
jgi:CspA family cold shock protein